VQAVLMLLYCPDAKNDDLIEWAMKYSKRAGVIIDNVNNVEIRELALLGKMQESARLIKEILDKEDTVENVKLAA
jgi:hypothetical protein